MPLPLLIDCDPGIDDAVALLIALAAPELELHGITTVAGNVPLPLTERNARAVLALAGRSDVLVHAGHDRPLAATAPARALIHGASGLGPLELPEPIRPLAGTDAVGFLIRTLRESPAPLTLAATGPLTNIASMLREAPDVAAKIARLVLMGGAAECGNVTPYAEFNVHFDPEAAAIVFASSVPVVMHGLDVTRQVRAHGRRIAEIAALDNPAARAVATMLDFYSGTDAHGGALHDPCVVAWLLAPELFAGRQASVEVETYGKERGRTRVTPDTAGPVTLVTEVDADGFFGLLTKRLARYG